MEGPIGEGGVNPSEIPKAKFEKDHHAQEYWFVPDSFCRIFDLEIRLRKNWSTVEDSESMSEHSPSVDTPET